MVKFAGFVAAIAMSGSVAMATDLTLTCTVNGSSNANVAPSSMVTYTITGELTDNVNEGLALVGFDLSFDGGALSQANAPTTAPMTNFDRNAGITNPAGFGGTIIGGNLVQVGGGQNTILNTLGNAPFPIGGVTTDVAQFGAPQIIATGSLTMPASGGPYHLNITNGFANVIKAGETGVPFWATEAVGTVNVVDCTLNPGCAASIASSVPANHTIDAQQPHTITAASPGQSFSTITLNLGCGALAAVAGNFTVTETGGTLPVPTITNVSASDDANVTLTLSAAIEAGAWTTITHNASTTATCIANLPGDVNSNLTSNTGDATALVAVLNGGASSLTQSDLNRSGVINAEDLTHLMNLLNGAGAFTPWLNISLPATPCT